MAQLVKNPPAMRETWVWSWIGKIPWRRAWQPTPVSLPGESPWTEEPGGATVHGIAKSRLRLSDINFRSSSVYRFTDESNCDVIGEFCFWKHLHMELGFPGGSVGKESAYYAGDAGDMGSIPVSGRSLGGGHGNPLQYSCWRMPWTRGAWWAT